MNGNSATLKPGQVWFLGDGVKGQSVKEGYEAAPASIKKGLSETMLPAEPLSEIEPSESQKNKSSSEPDEATPIDSAIKEKGSNSTASDRKPIRKGPFTK